MTDGLICLVLVLPLFIFFLCFIFFSGNRDKEDPFKEDGSWYKTPFGF